MICSIDFYGVLATLPEAIYDSEFEMSSFGNTAGDISSFESTDGSAVPNFSPIADIGRGCCWSDIFSSSL